MIYGLGTDLCDIPRLKAVFDKHAESFGKRVFNETELEDLLEMTPEFLARGWTVKEAVAKALGTGIGAKVGFHDITLSRPGIGKPTVELSAKAKAHFPPLKLHISLSHTPDYLSATVIAEEVKE